MSVIQPRSYMALDGSLLQAKALGWPVLLDGNTHLVQLFPQRHYPVFVMLCTAKHPFKGC